jgi:hypothetical protein
MAGWPLYSTIHTPLDKPELVTTREIESRRPADLTFNWRFSMCSFRIQVAGCPLDPLWITLGHPGIINIGCDPHYPVTGRGRSQSRRQKPFRGELLETDCDRGGVSAIFSATGFRHRRPRCALDGRHTLPHLTSEYAM